MPAARSFQPQEPHADASTKKNRRAQDIVNQCKNFIAPKKRKRKGPGRGGDRRSALFKAIKAGNPPPTKRERVKEVVLELAVERKLSK